MKILITSTTDGIAEYLDLEIKNPGVSLEHVELFKKITQIVHEFNERATEHA